MIFYREQYAEIELVLSSLEPLGILDTDYLEDAAGVDGYISLHHLASGARVSVPMSPVGSSTVNFRGFALLSSLQNGVYQIRGRVRDQWGNDTILSAVDNPAGGERVLELGFEIRAGAGVSICFGSLEVGGVLAVGEVHLVAGLATVGATMPEIEAVCMQAELTTVGMYIPQFERLDVATRCL
jgi:hypothetical protein